MTANAESPQKDVMRILVALGGLPYPHSRPALIVVSGLPGTGKSRFCRHLRERTGAVILESDALRKLLFKRPTHSARESQRLFTAIHAAIDRLLAAGVSSVLDATNLAERHREPLYDMVEKQGARLVLVEVTAPPDVVRSRLAGRAEGADPHDLSDADAAVYERMRRQAEEIPREHLVVDTSKDIGPALDTISREMERP
jgi:predicted kinase